MRTTPFTPDELAQIATTRDEWMRVGLSTDPIDRVETEAAIRTVYRTAGIDEPRIWIWMTSPLGVVTAGSLFSGGQLGDQLRGQLRAQLWDQLGDQLGDQLRDQARALIWKQVWGAWESYWLAYYDLGLAFSGDTPLRPRLNAMTAAAHTCGAWLPMRGAVIVGDRPDNIRRDNTGRLHSNNGPALTYADGYTLHAWHGTRVPAWVIDAPTIEQIAVERNTEIRRCAIESLGWPTYLDRLGVSPVSVEPDPGNPGHDLALYDVPDARSLFGGDVRLLVMSNASRDRDGSRRIFAETVPASCASAVDAAAWQFGADPTTYRALERAT